ncbi:MAG: membrane protein insertase YidC [Bacteroidales bacterium]|nr:membrane protein insertase YidC [Bacteroidales bacterium]
MSKSNVIGLIVIFALMGGYFWWTMKPMSEEQRIAAERRADSLVRVQMREDSIRLTREAMAEVEKNMTSMAEADSVVTGQLVDQYGAFAQARIATDEYYTVESEKLKITFSNLGGKIYSVQLKEFHTYDSLPLILFEGNTNLFGLDFFSNNRLIETDKFYFTPVEYSEPLVVEDENGVDFAMRLYPTVDDAVCYDKYIEYMYHVPYDDYLIDIDVNIVGMQDVIASHHGFIEMGWSLDLRQQEKQKENRLNGTNVFYKFYGDEDVNKLTENKDGEKKLPVKIEWISYKQQFFTTSLIARDDDSFLSGNVYVYKDNEKNNTVDRYIKTMKSELTLPYSGGDNETFSMSMYMGPNKFKELKKYDIGLEDQINLGGFFLVRWINRYGVLTVFNFLERFNWNYGIVILVLTVLLKLLLFPITYKSYLNGAKMKALKPEVDAINAKYPSQDDAMKKQQATMEMYKKFGVNPMSGCLPQLLQFPILIAMFRFFPVSFELRQQSFLWATDLSTYDSILDLSFNIPFYGDHVSLFTLLMTASTVVYTLLNNKTMGQTNQPGMKFMTYVMPIMFLGLFNSYSAGLSYYYLLANIITFLQMFIIGKIETPEKLRAAMLVKASQKKTKSKKSKWQQRLEDMQRIQQQQARENAKRK